MSLIKAGSSLPPDPARANLTDENDHRYVLFFTISAALFLSALICLPVLPGRMNFDSLAMYHMARIETYSDWHSLLMPVAFRAFGANDVMLAGCLIGVVWMVLFSLTLVLRAAGAGWRRSLAVAALICASPPVLGALTTHYRDTWVAALMLASAASIARETLRSAPYFMVLRAAGCIAMMLVRPDSIAVVPVLAMAEAFRHRRKWRQAALAATAFLAVTAAGFAAGQRLLYDTTGAARKYPEQVIMVFDLAALSLATQTNLLPAAVFPPGDLDQLQQRFSPVSIMAICLTNPLVRFTDDPVIVSQLRQAWLRAIIDNPAAYIRARLPPFLHYMKGGRTYHPGIDDSSPWGERVGLYFPAATNMVNGYLQRFDSTPVASHWLPFVGSFLLIAAAVANPALRRRPDVIPMLLIAIAYQAVFFFLNAVNDSYRYGLGSIILFYSYAYVVLSRWLADLRERLSGSNPLRSPSQS